MAQHYFDVLNTAGFFRDRESVACAGRAEIEAHARELLVLGLTHHDGGPYPVMVVVLDERFAPVLTLVANGDDARLVWGQPR